MSLSRLAFRWLRDPQNLISCLLLAGTVAAAALTVWLLWFVASIPT